MATSFAPRLVLGYVAVLTLGCNHSADRLIAQLGDGDPQQRRSAARALGSLEGDRSDAVAALSQAVRDPDLEVRELAANSLGQLGPKSKSGLPALRQALGDAELSVRVTAALAIQKIDATDESYVPVLIEALRAGNGPVFLEVRRMGADGKWAVPTLIALLSDRRVQIRALAAHALGGIGPAARDADAALRERLRDRDPSVRREVQNALRRIDSRDGSRGD